MSWWIIGVVFVVCAAGFAGHCIRSPLSEHEAYLERERRELDERRGDP